jgi:hypothetical protein
MDTVGDQGRSPLVEPEFDPLRRRCEFDVTLLRALHVYRHPCKTNFHPLEQVLAAEPKIQCWRCAFCLLIYHKSSSDATVS